MEARCEDMINQIREIIKEGDSLIRGDRVQAESIAHQELNRIKSKWWYRFFTWLELKLKIIIERIKRR